MIAQQTRPQDEPTPMIDVSQIAQGELAKALKGDPDQPQNIRLLVQGFG
jgi:hypothetical protein